VTYLQPTGAGPLQGQDLNRFLQQWMAGVLGAANLDQTLIRSYDQAEPPVIPESGTAWMAFRQGVDESDTYPYVATLPDGTGTTLQRHEEIAVLCSFYDLGTNGQAASLASLLRDGMSIPDNLEPLTLATFGMVGCEPEVVVPSLLKLRWLYRVDLPFRLRRAVTRTYGVPNITSAVGTVYTDGGLPPVPVLAHN
jgi:hypothetical protein